MDNAERARRFKKARIELSQHGPETQAQVYAATGISASAISNLENPESGRVPLSEKVNILAEYYGVNAAWLTGQSDSPSLNENSRIATDTIGLSPKSVEKLTRMMTNPQQKAAINEMIESDHFERLIRAIIVLTDKVEPDTKNEKTEQTVDFTKVVRQHTGDDPVAFNLAEGDLREYYSWKAEREMERLIQDVISERKGRGR